jgi:hypothetical protein
VNGWMDGWLNHAVNSHCDPCEWEILCLCGLLRNTKWAARGTRGKQIVFNVFNVLMNRWEGTSSSDGMQQHCPNNKVLITDVGDVCR